MLTVTILGCYPSILQKRMLFFGGIKCLEGALKFAPNV